MGAPTSEQAGVGLPGAERTVMARITCTDGSTVIGHMEVGVIFVPNCPDLIAPKQLL